MGSFSFKISFTAVVILCAQATRATDVVFESDVQIKRNDQNSFENLKAGQSIPLNAGDSVFALNGQNMPVLIVAPVKDKGRVVVADSNMSLAIQSQLQATLQKSTSEIIDGLRKAEGLIQKKDFNQASTIILSLKSKYKDISSLLFMSGTLSYLQNNKSAAIEDLQRGLSLDPNNEPAKKLLTQLKGTP